MIRVDLVGWVGGVLGTLGVSDLWLEHHSVTNGLGMKPVGIIIIIDSLLNAWIVHLGDIVDSIVDCIEFVFGVVTSMLGHVVIAAFSHEHLAGCLDGVLEILVGWRIVVHIEIIYLDFQYYLIN